MDAHNYNPAGSTPLYGMINNTIDGVIAKATEFEQGGVVVRTVTYIISDGTGTDGHQYPPRNVHKLVTSLLLTESHIIGAMGINDGYSDFTQVFNEMGIPDEWILTLRTTHRKSAGHSAPSARSPATSQPQRWAVSGTETIRLSRSRKPRGYHNVTAALCAA